MRSGKFTSKVVSNPSPVSTMREDAEKRVESDTRNLVLLNIWIDRYMMIIMYNIFIYISIEIYIYKYVSLNINIYVYIYIFGVWPRHQLYCREGSRDDIQL